MSEPSLARSAQPFTTDRIWRGRQLFEEHAGEIVHLEAATWLVPGSHGTSYLANLDAGTCDCGDFEHRGGLSKHLYAAQLADSKSRSCSCCGDRVLGRFTSEVTEEDRLLSWYPGDVLCADCIRRGEWA